MHRAWNWKQHSYFKRYGQELGALNHSPLPHCAVSDSLPHLPLPVSSQETHQSCRKLIYHTNMYLMEWVTVAGCENLKNERDSLRVSHGARRQGQPVSACSSCCVLRWQITVSNAALAAVGSYSHAAHETSAFSGYCGMGKHLGVSYQVKHSFCYHVDISCHSSQISTIRSLNASSTLGYQLPFTSMRVNFHLFMLN